MVMLSHKKLDTTTIALSIEWEIDVTLSDRNE